MNYSEINLEQKDIEFLKDVTRDSYYTDYEEDIIWEKFEDCPIEEIEAFVESDTANLAKFLIARKEEVLDLIRKYSPVEKVTKGHLEAWLGTDSREEQLSIILEVANGEYTPEMLNSDINEYEYEKPPFSVGDRVIDNLGNPGKVCYVYVNTDPDCDTEWDIGVVLDGDEEEFNYSSDDLTKEEN